MQPLLQVPCGEWGGGRVGASVLCLPPLPPPPTPISPVSPSQFFPHLDPSVSFGGKHRKALRISVRDSEPTCGSARETHGFT